jgi:hypothetical protein
VEVDMSDIWLAHHGIKGQRWGIRRFQNEDGSLTPRGEKHVKKNRGSDDYQEVQELRKKKTKDLSNEELKKIAERVQLEKAIKKGDEETKRILIQSGAKLLGTAAVVGAVAIGGKYVVKHLPDIAGQVAKAGTQATVNVTKEVAKGGAELAKSAAKTAAKATHEARKSAAKSDLGKSYVRAVDQLLGKKRRRP